MQLINAIIKKIQHNKHNNKKNATTINTTIKKNATTKNKTKQNATTINTIQ